MALERRHQPIQSATSSSAVLPGGLSEDYRAHVTAWWCEVVGGPARYTEELGGYEDMLAHHRRLGISPERRSGSHGARSGGGMANAE